MFIHTYSYAKARSAEIQLSLHDPDLTESELKDTYIEADVHKLSQVVRNVLSNGLKFTPKGGRVTVKVSRTGVRTAQSFFHPSLSSVRKNSGSGITLRRYEGFTYNTYLVLCCIYISPTYFCI